MEGEGGGEERDREPKPSAEQKIFFSFEYFGVIKMRTRIHHRYGIFNSIAYFCYATNFLLMHKWLNILI